MFDVDITTEVRGDQAVRGMLETESINYTKQLTLGTTGDQWRSRYLVTCVATQQHFNVLRNIFVITSPATDLDFMGEK